MCTLFSRRTSEIGRAHTTFSCNCQDSAKTDRQVSARLSGGRSIGEEAHTKGLMDCVLTERCIRLDRPMAVSPATPEGSFVVEDMEDASEPPMTSRDSGRS